MITGCSPIFIPIAVSAAGFVGHLFVGADSALIPFRGAC